MRNFKKFLALVLAMLMVSACAVSVSAFNDQAAIDATDFEDAVEILAELGVVKGDENGNYNPNNTLRRDEAAVIIAKLVAGVAGQSMDWVAETTKFADVDAKWSFAYINYVADRKIMVGTDLGFEPTRELQIDEALALALKAADPAAVRNVEIMNAQYPTNYWATYYISTAEELGIADNLGIIYDHEAACSKAMFAQIAVNMLNNSAIGDAFGYQTVDGTITSVDADNNKLVLTAQVVVEGDVVEVEKEINLTAFNAALAEAGYEKVAADMLKYKVSMQWSNKTGEIFEIDVLTSVDTVDYRDAALKYVPKDNTVEAAKLELNGKVYDIHKDDVKYDDDTAPDMIGGTVVDDLNNIRVYFDGSEVDIDVVEKTDDVQTIPAFYEVACFDDDADGDYERAYVTTYELVTLTKGDKVNHDGKADTADVESTVVKVFTKDGTEATTHALSGNYLTVAGAAYTAWGETPVLVCLNKGDAEKPAMTGKILETAEKVTGVVSSIKAGSYITIGDKIEFAAAYADPASWTLSQNVTVYTIGGKYVAVASADTGVESGMVKKEVLVDNVTVADGVALIDGFVWNSNGTLTPVADFKVVGYVNDADKLIAKAASELKNVIGDKTYAGLVGIGDLNDAGTEWKADKEIVTFEDGYVYSFYVTAEGAYYDDEVKNIETYEGAEYSYTTYKVEIKNGYIYEAVKVGETIGDASATRKLEDAYTVLAKAEATDAEVKKNAYATDSYSILTSFKFDTANVAFLAKNAAKVNGGQTATKVALVYASTADNTPVDAKQTKLNEGETIVKIVAVENETLTEATYVASDIFTGAKVEVTGNSAEGNYAVVKDGKIVDGDTLWVDTTTLDVSYVLDVRTIQGYNTMIVDPHAEGASNYRAYNIPSDAKKASFGVDAIKYWAYNDDGTIKEAAKLDDVLNKAGTVTFKGCIIDGTVVILDTPVYAD